MWNVSCIVNVYDSVYKRQAATCQAIHLLCSPAKLFTALAKETNERQKKKLAHKFAAQSVFESPRFCIPFLRRMSALSRVIHWH